VSVWGQPLYGENGPARMCLARKNGIFPARLRDVDERQPDRAFLRLCVGRADPAFASASSIQTGA
jgi:hypothetical protein